MIRHSAFAAGSALLVLLVLLGGTAAFGHALTHDAALSADPVVRPDPPTAASVPAAVFVHPAAAPSTAAGSAGEPLAQRLAGERGVDLPSWRPPGRSPWYRAGAVAGAAEAGAIVGADAIDGSLDRAPAPDPACSYPSQTIGELSAGVPPCNFCADPPCN